METRSPDRRDGRDRREGFVDAVLAGRVIAEHVEAEAALLEYEDGPELGILRAGLDGFAEGLARARVILLGGDVAELRALAQELAAEDLERFPGGAVFADPETEVFVPEGFELCPVCGLPLEGPAPAEGCVLVDEHEIEVLPIGEIPLA